MSSPKTAAKLTLFSDIRKYLVHFVQITLQNDIPILSIMFSHFLLPFFTLSLSYLALLPFSLPLLNSLSSPYLIYAPVLFESIFLIKSAQTILFRYFCCLLTRFPYKKRASYCIYQKVFVTLHGFSNSKLLLIHN